MCQRTLRVAETLYAGEEVKVVVREGKRIDAYRCEVYGSRVLWHHLTNATRDYRVTIGHDGKALCCNCKGAALGRVICRHMAATDKLLSLGVLVVQDEREIVEDVNETADERDAFYSMQIGG